MVNRSDISLRVVYDEEGCQLVPVKVVNLPDEGDCLSASQDRVDDSGKCQISDELCMARWGGAHRKRCSICKDCDFDNDFQGLCIDLHTKVVGSGRFNFKRVHQPVASGLHIGVWKCHLQGFDDVKVVELLEFGWPIDVEQGTTIEASHCNHQGAKEFSREMEEYFQKEIKACHIFGPFKEDPFLGKLHNSPLYTVAMKNLVERRVILDLSFPSGAALNEGMPKYSYLGTPFRLHLPSMDAQVALVRKYGWGCLLFKRDLCKAYQQIPVDPVDIHFLCFA